MEQQKQHPPRPILATLLSGVLPGTPSLGGAAEVEIDEALSVFGEACITFSDSQRALEWLALPSDVFGGQAPVSKLHTEEGRLAVRAQLKRIEHGVFH